MNGGPAASRDFSTEIVRRLRGAGFEAYWAGGCVRDLVLGRDPKDYDVATNATPDQIRSLFGRRNTHAVGEAFGVITVHGSPDAGMVEVATFREDLTYSDGRRPDAVRFATAELDAQRRDFTINGMFYDPIDQQVFDWVGGRHDLEHRIVRAIGDPHQRIAEDKLRMLRGVRFASTFGFSLDPATERAIQHHARELVVVSAERIGAEFARILQHPGRVVGLDLLHRCGLWEIVLPEFAEFGIQSPTDSRWLAAQQVLSSWGHEVPLELALAALLHGLPLASPGHGQERILGIADRLRFSRRIGQAVDWLVRSQTLLRHSASENWPRTQRCLADPRGPLLFDLADAIANVTSEGIEPIQFCRQQMTRPDWNPPVLLSGDDLQMLRISPGPQLGRLLEQVRDAQLLGELNDKDAALAWVRRRMDHSSSSS